MDLRFCKSSISSLFLILMVTSFWSCKTFRIANTNTISIAERFHETSLFHKSFTGFVLYDPFSNELLFEYEGGKHFTPASNTKIASLLATLEVMGDSLPIVQYLKIKDTIFFRGTGNPLNLNPYFADNNQLIDWIIDRRENQFIYVPKDPSPVRYGPGWAWDDYLYDYQLENSALPVYGNQITVKGILNELEVEPKILSESLTFKKDDLNDIKRSFEANDYVISSTVDSFNFILPLHWTDSLVVESLKAASGIDIHLLNDDNLLPADTAWITKSISFPDSLFVLLMQESDNFIAEQLLLASSNFLSDTLDQRVAIKQATQNWEPFLRDTMRWVDGSGLSRYNLFTPYTFVQLLDRLLLLKSWDWVRRVFPSGSHSGTIKEYYFPYVYAKTGTLSNNHNLSGFVETKEGRVLIFSFMHNHFIGSNARYKKEMEHMLQWIHENY